MTGNALYVIMRRYGPPYDATKPLEAQQDWEAHRAFMNDLEAKGISRLAGPLEGGREVLLVFRAPNADAVEQYLERDPWTRSGILTTISISKWDLRVGEVA